MGQSQQHTRVIVCIQYVELFIVSRIFCCDKSAGKVTAFNTPTARTSMSLYDVNTTSTAAPRTVVACHRLKRLSEGGTSGWNKRHATDTLSSQNSTQKASQNSTSLVEQVSEDISALIVVL
jgi:hypothetical protein